MRQQSPRAFAPRLVEAVEGQRAHVRQQAIALHERPREQRPQRGEALDLGESAGEGLRERGVGPFGGTMLEEQPPRGADPAEPHRREQPPHDAARRGPAGFLISRGFLC
jgi:hypothetical protein